MSWDWERAEKRPPVKQPRAIVSVAFSAEEFERISREAEQAGKPVSTYIRESMLERRWPHVTVARGFVLPQNAVETA